MRSQIDESLRRVYQEALEQELPDTLTALLDRLRAQEAQGAGGEKCKDEDRQEDGAERSDDRSAAGRGEALG